MARKPKTDPAAADDAPQVAPAAADEAAASVAPVSDAAIDAVAGPVATEGDVVVVHCPIASGRRRAGRRWEAGITRVPAAELSADDLAALEADPLLRVSLDADG